MLERPRPNTIQAIGANMTPDSIFSTNWILAICFTISSITPAESYASEPPSLEHRLIPPADFVYRGSFRVPFDRDRPAGGWFGYTSGFMTFNPDGNSGKGSIIAMGQDDSSSLVGEMSIPNSLGTGTIELLPRATSLQDFTDIRGALGKIQRGDIRQQTYGLAVIPANNWQPTPQLYWVSIYNYMPANSTTPNYASSLGRSNLDFSALQEEGQWNLAGRIPAHYGWYALTLPKMWADVYVHGQYLGVGRDRINSANGQGWGPSLYTTAPWASKTPLTNGAELANTKLLGYTQRNPLSRNYAHGDGARGATWAYTKHKSAFIVTYNKGMRTSADVPGGDYPYEDYKMGQHLGLPLSEITTYQPDNADYKSGPWFATLLLYDTTELGQVANGNRRPDSIKPYATFNLEKYFKHHQGQVPSKHLPIGGTAYDSVNNRLFVMELSSDDQRPIIHVFEIQDSAKTLALTPPTPPVNIRNTGATVTWSPSITSAGDSDSVSYLVFKWFPAFTSEITGKSWPAMWRPIAGTTKTTWTDPGYKSGDRYNVTAYDALMQPSHILNGQQSDSHP